MRNIKVAIIDDKVLDSDRLLSLLNNYFDNSQDYSIQTKVFATAFQFLDEFSNNYDLLFLDINMPQMNGLELANKIREINNNIALIFVTNYASLAIDGYGVDALGFIVKPVKQIELNKQKAEEAKKYLEEDTNELNASVTEFNAQFGTNLTVQLDDEGNITSSPISSDKKASKKVVYDRGTSGKEATLFSINKYKVTLTISRPQLDGHLFTPNKQYFVKGHENDKDFDGQYALWQKRVVYQMKDGYMIPTTSLVLRKVVTQV